MADIDECMFANGGCADQAVCYNTPGTHNCLCKHGYNGDGRTCVGKSL